MLLDKLDGVGADRQVKWRFSLAVALQRLSARDKKRG